MSSSAEMVVMMMMIGGEGEEEEKERRAPSKGHPSERGRGRWRRGRREEVEKSLFTPSGRRPVLETEG